MLDIKQEYIGTKDLAKLLGISESAVIAFRSEGTGPDYIKVGRLCRYRISDVEKWIAENNPRKS